MKTNLKVLCIICVFLQGIPNILAKKTELVVQSGHSKAINSLAFSPSGEMLASASWDNTVKLWDLKTGKELRTLMGHTDYVWDVKFNPNGESIASCDKNGIIIIWDVNTGKKLQTLSFNNRLIKNLAYNKDGSLLLSVSDRITVWDPTAGRKLREIRNSGRSLHSIVFSPDFKYLAGYGNVVKLWDFETGKLIKVTKDSTFGMGDCNLVFSSDGNFVIEGGTISMKNTGIVKIRDVKNMQMKHFLKVHEYEVIALACNPDLPILGIGCLDGTIILWDLQKNKELYKLTGHRGSIYCLAFHPNGKILASSGLDKIIKLWDIDSRNEICTLKGEVNNVYSISFVKKDSISLLASSGSDNSIRLWNLATCNPFKILSGKVFNEDERIKFGSTMNFPNGTSYIPERFLVQGSKTAGMSIWIDPYNFEPPKLYINQSSMAIYSVAFSPDNSMIATGDGFGNIRVWYLGSNKEPTLFKGHDDWILSICFTSDNKYLVSTSRDQFIKVWDLKTKSIISAVKEQNEIWYCDISPDGMFITCSGKNFISVWDYKNKEKIWNLDEDVISFSPVQISPDGNNLAIADKEFFVQFRDMKTGKLLSSIDTNQEGISAIDYNSDGHKLATGSFDRSIKIWDTDTGTNIYKFTEFTYSIYSVDFSPDGQTLAASALGGGIKIWDLRCGTLIYSLDEESNTAQRIAFSQDGKYLVSNRENGMTTLWDNATKNEVLTLTSLEKDEWLVTSPDARFDCSSGARNNVNIIHVLKDTIISGNECCASKYTPGLLEKLTFNGHSDIVFSFVFL